MVEGFGTDEGDTSKGPTGGRGVEVLVNGERVLLRTRDRTRGGGVTKDTFRSFSSQRSKLFMFKSRGSI